MTGVIKCNSCNIVIDELLAYVQNKVSLVDEITLVRICKSAFSSDEIKNSKSLLFDSIPTVARKINRKSKGKEERDLLDIFNVFKSTEPDVIPVFVARQLERLPPILFNSLDCTRLLKDMLKFQNDLAEIKETYATLDQLKGLKLELLANKYDTCPLTPICNVNTKRGAAWALDTMDSGPVGILQCNSTLDSYHDREQATNNDHPNKKIWEVGAQKTTHGSAVEQRSSGDKSGNDDAATLSGGVARPKPAVPERQLIEDTVNNSGGLVKRVTHEPSSIKLLDPLSNNEGKWEKVESRKKQRKYRYHGKYGIARDLQCNFKAAERKVPVLITNVHRETTENDIIQYIYGQTKDTVSLKEINIQKRRDYKAYKMYVSKNKLHMYLNENLWPEDIIFRRFVNYTNGGNSVIGLETKINAE
ncbi:uncharacterized protein LOC133523647 [Cydia pomonella]|uniref:uncharacterized protein LOC133523647 n=1 Tax=Cydia pomonella TaxID=82600 RepID=UPI002ADE02BC|nr:uncharacterized protein LOC133523647 [Cydia pomonella]